MEKVLIVANLAGFVSFLLNDIDTLQQMGYQVLFAANGECLPWDDSKHELDKRNVEFVQVDFDSKNPFSKNNIKAYKQIKNILKRTKFKLIHCHTPIAGLLTRLAAIKYRKYGMKILYTTHGFAFTSYSSLKTKMIYRTLEKIGSYFCDGIITINQEDYASAKELNAPAVYYIHGVGVDIARYRDVQIDRHAYRASVGVTDDDIMVLSVGELSNRKNHQIIIHAISLIPQNERFVYVICGNGINGGTGKQLEELARQKNVRLKLLGFRRDIPELTKSSDIGAIPSIREGLGLAGIQSLAAGVPLVGTDVQGIRDYIRHGQNGYLANAFDANGFAKALNVLANMSSEDRNKMTQVCKTIAQSFDTGISVQEMRLIYKEILQ